MLQAWEKLEAFNSACIRVVVHLQAGLNANDPDLPGGDFIRSHLMEGLRSLSGLSSGSGSGSGSSTSASTSDPGTLWRVDSRWGDVSLACAMVHGAGYAIEHFPNAVAVVYASGSDVPLLVRRLQAVSLRWHPLSSPVH
jgi:hypothetical protein